MFRPAFTASARLSRRSPISLHIARIRQDAPLRCPRSHQIPTNTASAPAVTRLRKILQYGLAGVFAIGISAAIYYEGAHLYIEHMDMLPETDSEVKKWEWNFINTNWTGDPSKGGTDPSLGYRARHILHGAYAAYTEATPGTAVIVEETPSGAEVMHVVDSRLQQTEHHLRNTILIAEGKLAKNNLNPSSFVILLLRHAAVSEQIGIDRFLLLAKEDYERAWQYTKHPDYQDYIAWKLGDLNSRLGNNSDALLWWDRSSQVVQEPRGDFEDGSTTGLRIPQTPLAQRILSSILVSKSAHLAASGKLKDAQALEESALEFLRSIRPPDSIASASPPQALHALYLLQRSSLLSMHLAEVLRARRGSVLSSIQWLASAAESSERVAHILTGSQLQTSLNPDTENPSTRPKNNQLLSVYTDSLSMNSPATALLRDARRTVAEAWNMMGVLHEDYEGSRSRSALNCYERAVNSAGMAKPKGDGLQAADDILESDWKIYWANYQRLKNAQERSG